MEILKTLNKPSVWTGKLEQIVLFLLVFLFPILALPIMPNVYTQPKLILLALAVGVILLIKAVRIVVERKLVFNSSSFDSPLFLFLIAYLISVVIMAPNKIEALTDPVRGALQIVFLVTLLFSLPKNRQTVLIAGLSSLVVLLLSSLAGYFSLLNFLPESLAFLNVKGASLTGNLLSQALFAGFFLALSFDALNKSNKNILTNASELIKKSQKDHPVLLNGLFIASLLTLVLSVFVLIKDLKPQFIPFIHSWQISVDTLKTAKTALFGVGPANYLTLYTRSKPIGINAIASLWNLNVEFSRSAALHIFTEAGLLAFAALVLVFINLFNRAKQNKKYLVFTVLVIWSVFFPVSQFYFFTLFLAIYLARQQKTTRQFDLKDLDIFAYTTAGIIAAVVLVFAYFFYRYTASNYVLAQSFNAARANEAQKVYDLQTQAIRLNPYNEQARINFTQTNVLLANNIARKKKLTDQDKQTISTLIQQSIAAAKDMVALNPNKAIYWANLGEVYRNIIGIAEGSDEWTVASFQRAISMDPRNPGYYFSMGSVYYSLGNYTESIGFFQQAISLKQDVPNYYYNLAWANYQVKDYRRAVNALETAMRFITEGTDDYKKVKKELEEFKAMIPDEKTSQEEQLQPETLTQPLPIPSGKAEIELPEDSAPPTISLTPTPTK